MSEVYDLSDDTLVAVKVLWSTKYAVPIFVLPDGTRYVPDTGEYAGYYSTLVEAVPKAGILPISGRD